MPSNRVTTLPWGGERFSKVFCLFTVSLLLSVLVGSLALMYAPTSAYAEEQTDKATTEVYLVKTDDGTTPKGETTTITTTTTTDNPSTTTKTGDSTPVIPFVVAGIVMAAVSIVAAKKLATIGGENL